MDSGEEIPNLDEGWTLAGFKATELGMGFVMFMLASELLFGGLAKTGTKGLYFFIILIGTAVAMRALRMRFCDEERGARNFIMTKCGFTPPGVPTPADLQQRWSGMPMKEFPPEREYVQLGLRAVLLPEENPESK